MRKKSLRNIGPTLPGFEMSESVEHIISQPSISSVVDSPANLIASLESAKQVQTNATYGESFTASFARLDPLGLWLKTYQDCYQAKLDGSLEEYSETWPKQGTMQNGNVYERPTLEHPISENESSLWPT